MSSRRISSEEISLEILQSGNTSINQNDESCDKIVNIPPKTELPLINTDTPNNDTKLFDEKSTINGYLKDNSCDAESMNSIQSELQTARVVTAPESLMYTKSDENDSQPGTMTIDAYFLAMAFELPGFLQKKPLLFVGIVMPFIDVILDFISAGIDYHT